MQSVCGPVLASALGVTLAHEHVTITTPGIAASLPDPPDTAWIRDLCVEDLRRVRAAGVTALIDHSTVDLGRNPTLLREVSEASGVHIIAATGLWHDTPRYFWHRDAEDIAELWVNDLEKGFHGQPDAIPPIRAGVIKCAVEQLPVTPAARTVIRSAALAHVATGAPITTHTSCQHQTAPAVLSLLLQAGADPSRILIGHAGDTRDIDYLLPLLDTGAYLGVDRFGIATNGVTDTDRITLVAELCRRGHAGQLLLSHDHNSWSDHWTDPVRRQHPDWSKTRISTAIVPQLQAAGVSREELTQMLVSNPAKYLTGGGT